MNDISTLQDDNNPKFGIKTGFVDLDRMIYGFHPAELILIGGRPGMGKTVLMSNMIHHMGVYDKRSVLLFSLDDTKEQFLKNVISSEAHIDRSKYDFCSMTDTELEEYHKETKKLKDSSIFVDDTPECTVEEICDKCRSYKADHGVEVVFIDYLQLVSSDFKTESRSKEMLYICGKLKELAKELDLPIVVLSQLSRAVEQRKSHRPKISDLSDLVGDAVAMFDVILFLYRHEYYHRNSYRKGIAELIVARSGETKKRSSCLLMWLQPFLKFANLESW